MAVEGRNADLELIQAEWNEGGEGVIYVFEYQPEENIIVEKIQVSDDYDLEQHTDFIQQRLTELGLDVDDLVVQTTEVEDTDQQQLADLGIDFGQGTSYSVTYILDEDESFVASESEDEDSLEYESDEDDD